MSIPQAGKRWIEDKGDFYIVRVPGGKTFKSEQLDKPTIFIMGESAKVIDAFAPCANIIAPFGGFFEDCRFDASGLTTARPRAVVEVSGNSKSVFLGTTYVTGGRTTDCGVRFL